MVTEVKLNNLNTQYVTDNHSTSAQQKPMEPSNEQQAVAVTNHLNQLVKLINTCDEPLNTPALNHIKHQVQQNEYRVNLDTLADRMLKNGLATPGDD